MWPAKLQAERWWLGGVGAAAAENSSCRRCSGGKHLTVAVSEAWLQGREGLSWEERGRGWAGTLRSQLAPRPTEHPKRWGLHPQALQQGTLELARLVTETRSTHGDELFPRRPAELRILSPVLSAAAQTRVCCSSHLCVVIVDGYGETLEMPAQCEQRCTPNLCMQLV